MMHADDQYPDASTRKAYHLEKLKIIYLITIDLLLLYHVLFLNQN